MDDNLRYEINFSEKNEVDMGKNVLRHNPWLKNYGNDPSSRKDTKGIQNLVDH